MNVSQSESTLSVVGSPDDAATVVAPGTHIVGRLSGQEDIRVHGTIEGRLNLAATLFVEPEGILAADVHAHDIVIAGTVVGNLSAAGSIVLAASARVVGDLRAPRLVVAPGAAVRGQVSMDALDEEDLEAEAEASRGRSEGRSRWSQPAARSAPTRAATHPSGVRLPPQRTVSAPRRELVLKHRASEPTGEAYGEAEEPEWGDGVKRAKKVARPRILARGKHKVERL